MTVDENRPQSGWGSRIVKGFYKSWAWIASVAGFVLAVGPDLANLALSNTGAIAAVFPEMSLKNKAIILLVANILVIVLRPYKQPKSFRPDEGATQPVAVIQVPDTVAVGPEAVIVATEVEYRERDPGPPS